MFVFQSEDGNIRTVLDFGEMYNTNLSSMIGVH